MLERLINEDKEGAEELFHEIVVEKSRNIYESLLEDDLSDADLDEASKEDDEEVDEAADEDDKDVEEASEDDDDEQVDEEFDLDEFEVEADPMMGGDPADDMMGDVEMGGDMDMDMGDEEGGDMEDRVEDLEDALDELKAEFEKLMAGEEGEEEHSDMDDMGGDEEDEGDEDEGDEEADESFAFEADEEEEDEEVEESKSTKSAAEQMREYVEKVSAKMGDNGANTKSPLAGKNDMGGTASNLVAGGEADTKGTAGGLANPSEKEDNMGNVNVPGGKASKSMKAQPKGHGAEKKGQGDTAANKKSIIGSR